MRLEAVAAFLSRGGHVTRCPRGAFGWTTESAPDRKQYQQRGGVATRKRHRGTGRFLGEQVRVERIRRGLKRRELAKILCRSEEWVRLLETGKIQHPTGDTRKAVDRWLAK